MFGIQEIDSLGLSSMLGEDGENLALIDVRSPAEMVQGMLPGADAIPMHLIPLRLEELRSKEKIVFYCRTGARSGQVCAFLQQQGIDNAINLRGGIVDWHRQGYPIDFQEAGVIAG